MNTLTVGGPTPVTRFRSPPDYVQPVFTLDADLVVIASSLPELTALLPLASFSELREQLDRG